MWNTWSLKISLQLITPLGSQSSEHAEVSSDTIKGVIIDQGIIEGKHIRKE